MIYTGSPRYKFWVRKFACREFLRIINNNDNSNNDKNTSKKRIITGISSSAFFRMRRADLEVCVEGAEIQTRVEGQGEVDVLGRVRPRAEPHVALLAVEREVGDVNGTRGLELLVRHPHDCAVIEDGGQRVAGRHLRLSTEVTSSRPATSGECDCECGRIHPNHFACPDPTNSGYINEYAWGGKMVEKPKTFLFLF